MPPLKNLHQPDCSADLTALRDRVETIARLQDALLEAIDRGILFPDFERGYSMTEILGSLELSLHQANKEILRIVEGKSHPPLDPLSPPGVQSPAGKPLP